MMVHPRAPPGRTVAAGLRLETSAPDQCKCGLSLAAGPARGNAISRARRATAGPHTAAEDRSYFAPGPPSGG